MSVPTARGVAHSIDHDPGALLAELLDHADLDALDAEVLEAIEESVRQAKAAPRPTAEDVLTDVYISY